MAPGHLAEIVMTTTTYKLTWKTSFFICAVATQGSSANHWTKKYKLRYSLDNSTWLTYQENDTDKVCLDTRKLATQLELLNGPFPSCSKPLYQSKAKCETIDMKIIISWEYSFSQEILVLNTGNSEITESLLNREPVLYQLLTNLTQTSRKKTSVSNPPPPPKEKKPP